MAGEAPIEAGGSRSPLGNESGNKGSKARDGESCLRGVRHSDTLTGLLWSVTSPPRYLWAECIEVCTTRYVVWMT